MYRLTFYYGIYRPWETASSVHPCRDQFCECFGKFLESYIRVTLSASPWPKFAWMRCLNNEIINSFACDMKMAEKRCRGSTKETMLNHPKLNFNECPHHLECRQQVRPPLAPPPGWTQRDILTLKDLRVSGGITSHFPYELRGNRHSCRAVLPLFQEMSHPAHTSSNWLP